MGKKVMGSDGKMYKVKKPFYQRVWFWLIAVIVVFIGVGTLGGGDNESGSNVKKVDSEEKSTSTESTTEGQKEETFKIGDTASIDGYEIKVNSVEFQDGSEYNKPAEGKQFVIINITITNNTDEKQSFNPLDYSLNEDGVSSSTGFTYADGVDSLSSGDLDKGASVTGNLVGEANPNSKLKLRYQGNFFLSNHEVDFELN